MQDSQSPIALAESRLGLYPDLPIDEYHGGPRHQQVRPR